MCPWIQRLIIIHHKFQKQLNNDHCLQFITGTTVDPPANNSDDEEYFDEEEYENDGTPWVCKVDWSLPHTGRDIFGCCDGKNISQFSG